MICESCGGTIEIGSWPFCPDHSRGFSNVIGDEIDERHENLGDKIVSFKSREEKKRYLKEHGIYDATRHVGAPGSDKSKHTSRWV